MVGARGRECKLGKVFIAGKDAHGKCWLQMEVVQADLGRTMFREVCNVILSQVTNRLHV